MMTRRVKMLDNKNAQMERISIKNKRQIFLMNDLRPLDPYNVNQSKDYVNPGIV